jgi:hypothetical protein
MKGNRASRGNVRVVHLQDDAVSGQVIKMMAVSQHSIRMGNEDNGHVRTQHQDR